ncbi:MAG TPA: zf-HC2 domain-containing protein [Pyrinomonadaceae bacterium]|jgi:predicted anti-sigma-YlaC factor YlaD|nr:zf-HC2 domain-containing protein [Pyrinomonadaceae bacterium]
MIDCARSLELLSDYLADDLNQVDQDLVKTHLAVCPPCTGVLQDLNSIRMAATILRMEGNISFPDENAVWQRLGLAKGPIH